MVPTTLLVLAAAAVGVDTGWTKLDSGGYEYIIQISPEQLESLRAGGEFGSDLPAGTGAIRSYKILVGSGPLLNQGVPLPPEAQVSYKPPVNTPKAGAKDADKGKVEANKAQTGQWRGGATTDPGREPPAQESATASRQVDSEFKLNTPKTLSERDRVHSPINAIPEAGAGSDEGDDDQSKAGNASRASKASADEPEDVGANAPETEAVEPTDKASLKFWNVFLTVLTIMLGSLIGWFGFLAWDFRNRYLELLHDLDTQSNPVEAPAERYETEHEEEEEETDDRESRRPQRSAMAYVGRKSSRHQDEDSYEEE